MGNGGGSGKLSSAHSGSYPTTPTGKGGREGSWGPGFARRPQEAGGCRGTSLNHEAPFEQVAQETGNLAIIPYTLFLQVA
jgi:hypothetical protein